MGGRGEKMNERYLYAPLAGGVPAAGNRGFVGGVQGLGSPHGGPPGHEVKLPTW